MNIEQKRQALGKRIRAVREEQGLSQSQLALRRGALDQLVVGFLKQILKINQMLKVSHG